MQLNGNYFPKTHRTSEISVTLIFDPEIFYYYFLVCHKQAVSKYPYFTDNSLIRQPVRSGILAPSLLQLVGSVREIAAPRCVEMVSLKDHTFGIRERAEIPADTCKIAPVVWWEFEYFLSIVRKPISCVPGVEDVGGLVAP